jgi:hypothetical protein
MGQGLAFTLENLLEFQDLVLQAEMDKFDIMVPVITKVYNAFHYELAVHHPKDHQVFQGDLAFGEKSFFVL